MPVRCTKLTSRRRVAPFCYCFDLAQELGIRLNVLTRFAAYGCPMPRKVYDMMHKTQSPIANRLFQASLPLA